MSNWYNTKMKSTKTQKILVSFVNHTVTGMKTSNQSDVSKQNVSSAEHTQTNNLQKNNREYYQPWLVILGILSWKQK